MIKIILFLVTFTWIEATFFGIGEIISGNGQASTISVSESNYEVYWNVPTFMCHKYGLYFEEVERNYGIIQNRNDDFRGEKIVILYDPGMFPALLKNPNGSIYRRNGGVPQEGDLRKHLDLFKVHLEEQIDENFSGLGVIDFESWRPIFRQNWASLEPYRYRSISIERARHPFWNDKSIKQESVRRFEKAGRIFMAETIKLAKSLRRKASWGYYAYPYCFNLTPHQSSWRCDGNLQQDNDNISWLWKVEDVLLPSVYLRLELSMNDKVGLITGRLQESARIINKYALSSKILPYFWYKYTDQRDILLSRDDIYNSFHAMLNNGASGHVIWGSSNDFSSEQKCQEFRDYLNDILGPAVLEIKELAGKLAYTNENIVGNSGDTIESEVDNSINYEIINGEENPSNKTEQ